MIASWSVRVCPPTSKCHSYSAANTVILLPNSMVNANKTASNFLFVFFIIFLLLLDMIFYFFIFFLLKEKRPICIPPVAIIGMEKLESFFLLLSLFMIFQSLSSDVTFFTNSHFDFTIFPFYRQQFWDE